MRSQMTFRRAAAQNTAFLEVRIFRDNREALTAGILPDGFIIRASQSARMHMDRSGEFTLQHVRQTRRQILVKQQLHAFCNSSLRSRSAAYARQARISSSVR